MLTPLGVIHKVRTHGGGGGSRPMRTHCVHGGRGGSGCCVRTHFLKYSSKVITFNKLYIIVEYRHILHKVIAWENDLLILYYVYYI